MFIIARWLSSITFCPWRNARRGTHDIAPRNTTNNNDDEEEESESATSTFGNIVDSCKDCGVWCGRGAGVVGVGGIALLVAGAIQAALGIYYMLTMPIFSCGSNIWTGGVGVFTGLLMMFVTWTNQTNRKAKIVLATSLLTLVVNVVNLVIVQVGENGLFLTEEDTVYITAMGLEEQVVLAIWLSTGATGFSIIVSFLVAQVVFCISLRHSPHIKGHFSLASRYSEKNKFYSTTRSLDRRSESEEVNDSEATPRSRQNFDDTLRTLNERLDALPTRKQSSAWVYCADEDDTTTSLYPMGIEMPNDFNATTRKRPVRHSSFAMPRYAKVHRRPQRAHSFAQQRDLNIEKILNGSTGGPNPIPLPEIPRPKLLTTPRGQYAKPNRPVGRSNSMQITKLEKSKHEVKLSYKFQSCSLDELESSSVLEVGSLASGKSSEHSLVDALTDIPSRSLNSMQTSGFATSSSQSQEVDSQSKRYSHMHSFSTPTLHSIESMEKSVHSSSSASTQCIIPEPDYAKPNQINKKNENISSSYFKTDMYDSHSQENKPFHTFQSTFIPSNRIKKNKSQAPLPPIHNFLPRLSTLKPHFNTNPNLKNNDTTDKDYFVEDDLLNNRAVYQSSDHPSVGQNSEMHALKYSGMRHSEGRITHFDSNPLPVIEENDRLSNEEYDSSIQSQNSIEEHSKNLHELQKPAVPTTPKPKTINIAKNGITKPPRYSVLQKKIINSRVQENTNTLQQLNAPANDIENCTGNLSPTESSNEFQANNLSSMQSSQTSFESTPVHENRSEQLERIPSGEMKRNKIILRVPSFRTAGCQTDTYRPVRRRASCAQTNLSVAPRSKDSLGNSQKAIPTGTVNKWSPSFTSQTNAPETSSSSSGYSSPEVSSKEPSPNHSGPPSPADKTTNPNPKPRRSKSNVTVIEINKSETLISTISEAPPRPPKPIRFRHSAAADLSSAGLLLPIQRRTKPPPAYQDLFPISPLSDSIFSISETIKPMNTAQPSVHQRKFHFGSSAQPFRKSNSIPRIVDMQPKRKSDSEEMLSTAEVFAEDGRTSVLPRLRNSALSASLPRSAVSLQQNKVISEKQENPFQNRWNELLDWEVGQRWREEREKELASRWAHDREGRATAAYLASLELLASHYRHQALANAKKLQRQKQLLEQRQEHQNRPVIEDPITDLEDSDQATQVATVKYDDEEEDDEEDEFRPASKWRATIEDLRKYPIHGTNEWNAA